jgi:hypothetical protein
MKEGGKTAKKNQSDVGKNMPFVCLGDYGYPYHCARHCQKKEQDQKSPHPKATFNYFLAGYHIFGNQHDYFCHFH